MDTGVQLRLRPADTTRAPRPPAVPRRPSRLDRVLARVSGPALDQRLACGEDPATSDQLRCRAEYVARRATREAAARGLARVLANARNPSSGLSCVVPADRRATLLAEPALLALIDRLRDDAPVNPAGVAEIRMALSDGASLFYVPPRADDLRLWARNVMTQLTEHGA